MDITPILAVLGILIGCVVASALIASVIKGFQNVPHEEVSIVEVNWMPWTKKNWQPIRLIGRLKHATSIEDPHYNRLGTEIYDSGRPEDFIVPKTFNVYDMYHDGVKGTDGKLHPKIIKKVTRDGSSYANIVEELSDGKLTWIGLWPFTRIRPINRTQYTYIECDKGATPALPEGFVMMPKRYSFENKDVVQARKITPGALTLPLHVKNQSFVLEILISSKLMGAVFSDLGLSEADQQNFAEIPENASLFLHVGVEYTLMNPRVIYQLTESEQKDDVTDHILELLEDGAEEAGTKVNVVQLMRDLGRENADLLDDANGATKVQFTRLFLEIFNDEPNRISNPLTTGRKWDYQPITVNQLRVLHINGSTPQTVKYLESIFGFAQDAVEAKRAILKKDFELKIAKKEEEIQKAKGKAAGAHEKAYLDTVGAEKIAYQEKLAGIETADLKTVAQMFENMENLTTLGSFNFGDILNKKDQNPIQLVTSVGGDTQKTKKKKDEDAPVE